MIHHRAPLREVFGIIALVLAAGVAGFECNLGGSIAADKQIDFREAVGLAVLIVSGLVGFGWRRIVEQEREIARRGEAERRAHELANTDPLTGLANRRQFERALKEAATYSPSNQHVHAILSIDLKKFERINHVFGHAEGDEVLVAVAERLRGAMSDGDLLARLGSDEFAVLGRHLAGPETATNLAARIAKALECPIETRSNRHIVGAAVGIALIPHEGGRPEVALRKADLALHRAKADKDRVHRLFELEMDAQSRERDFLELELPKALAAGELIPWYQPVFDLGANRAIGFEALARWHHPSLGQIPPDRFIPVAEECGLMGELSDGLLRRACLDARNWPDDAFLAFNISPSQLRETTFGLHILNILGETGLSPARLEIEVTESAILRDLDTARNVLSSLREAGVRIALDDFGTGYANLYHLRNFKFDAIKIDRSFVHSMAFEREAAAIVQALTGLGHALGLVMTAEGIEQAGQRKSLLLQGCQRGQGYLFSPAVEASHTARFFSAPKPRLVEVGLGAR